jgi:hypothetical protein
VTARVARPATQSVRPPASRRAFCAAAASSSLSLGLGLVLAHEQVALRSHTVGTDL